MSVQQPGWYSDPLGHADRRWFDGTSWTASVLDAGGREGVDQLPSAAAPAAAIPSGTIPPPPGATGAETWAGPAGAGTWADDTWQAPRSMLPAVAPQAAAWSPQSQQPTAAPSRQPARVSGTSRLNPVSLGLCGLAVVAFVLSLFVLDWVSVGSMSAGFADVVGDGATADAFLDKVTIWHFEWLGYVLVVAALASVAAFVLFGAGSPRAGHVVAAVVAAVGALVSTLAIVRAFRGADPEFGAWLLPAGFFVLIAAVVVSAAGRRSVS